MQRLFIILFGLFALHTSAQDRWQQNVDYTMDIVMDTEAHQFHGQQTVEYTNNSPEELNKVFYHLFFNAFQPGSMMDVRSRTIEDPDSRVADRIANLTEEEQGWIKVNTLKVNGKAQSFKVSETILEVSLSKPIKPLETVKIEMDWDAQIPIQIRRSGRDNKEGIDYSMAQWYPKMCEYDYEGWHANPYIGREFHGVWGNFNVNITIDSDYILGSTGMVTNGNEVGYGYGEVKQKKGKTTTWKIRAENVHDFVWAADKDYLHDIHKMADGTELHFLYKNDPEIIENWKELQQYTERAFDYMNKNFGQYPYKKYSVIQGGDGGMEYPMATLITGNRNLRSLVGVTVHEGAHSWYQGLLGSNESLYEWMDEGFTSYATEKTMLALFGQGQFPPHFYAYRGYLSIAGTGDENPLSTHADHYTTNRAYGIAAYSKGEVLLNQLNYVIGKEHVERGLMTYFDEWKFKHPNPTDFKRVMEIESEIELDWYFQYFVNSTHTIDYGIKKVEGINNQTHVVLEKVGKMPMPQEVVVTYKDGTKEQYYIPLVMMRGNKPNEFEGGTRIEMEPWPWTNPERLLIIDRSFNEIVSIELDPEEGMADIDRSNNSIDFTPGTEYYYGN